MALCVFLSDPEGICPLNEFGNAFIPRLYRLVSLLCRIQYGLRCYQSLLKLLTSLLCPFPFARTLIRGFDVAYDLLGLSTPQYLGVNELLPGFVVQSLATLVKIRILVVPPALVAKVFDPGR